MCIFSGKVENVSKTSILVSICGSNRRQLVVYQNKVRLSRHAPVKMILPVPVPESAKTDPNCGIVFYDTSGAPNIFDVLEKFFPRLERTLGRSRYFEESSDSLEIVSVGSYRCSIARNVEEIVRANEEVFGTMDPKLHDVLRKHYAGPNWAFVICTISASDEFHPIAYSFPRQDTKGPLFVPTRHFHGSSDEDTEDSDSDADAVVIVPDIPGAPEIKRRVKHVTAPAVDDEDLVAKDWDHSIFVYGAEFGPSATSSGAIQWGTGERSRFTTDMKLPVFPQSIEPKRLAKITIVGEAPNCDLQVNAKEVVLEKTSAFAKVKGHVMSLFRELGHDLAEDVVKCDD